MRLDLDDILAKARGVADPDTGEATSYTLPNQATVIELVERLKAAERERDEAWKVADQRWQDRYDALNVKSRDGLLSSEWLLRTGRAERERDEARQAHADAQEMLEEVAAERDRKGEACGAALEVAAAWVRQSTHYLLGCRDRDLALDACAERIRELLARLASIAPLADRLTALDLGRWSAATWLEAQDIISDLRAALRGLTLRVADEERSAQSDERKGEGQ